MAERVLRGSRLGAVSYETDRGAELAERRIAAYDCPRGHRFMVPFAAEADVPGTWECRTCGGPAMIVDGERPAPRVVKPTRTHWDMLLERRSLGELEDLLAERLGVLRAAAPAPVRGAAKKSA